MRPKSSFEVVVLSIIALLSLAVELQSNWLSPVVVVGTIKSDRVCDCRILPVCQWTWSGECFFCHCFNKSEVCLHNCSLNCSAVIWRNSIVKNVAVYRMCSKCFFVHSFSTHFKTVLSAFLCFWPQPSELCAPCLCHIGSAVYLEGVHWTWYNLTLN